MFTVVKTTVGSDVRTKNIPNGLEAYKDSVGFIYLKFKEGADHAFLLLEGTKRKCLVEVEDTPLPSDAVLLTEFL